MTRPVAHSPSLPVREALLGAAAAALVAGGALAQDAAKPADPAAAGDVLARPKPSVDDLLKRLETLEDRNRELEQKVTDLNLQQGESWLGEQRASQIREIVRDVLADSAQRQSLQDSGMTAGWNDGFFMASADGRFRLELGGFVQTRFIWSNIQTGKYGSGGPNNQFVYDRNPNRYGFDLPNVQLWADGHIFSRDFSYMVKARFFEQVATTFQKGSNTAQPGNVDFSGFELMDAWLRVNLDNDWSMRAGQFRSPFSRGFLVLEQYQMSASRSVVDYHYALGYTQGLELEYASDEFRVRGSINNGEQDSLLGDAAATPTDATFYKVYPTGSYGGMNAPWWEQNAQLSFTGRFEWKPSGTWNQFRSYTSPTGEPFGSLLGVGVHWQESKPYQFNQGTPGVKDPQSQWVAATVDGQVNFGGASLYGAGFYNYIDGSAAVLPQYGANTSTVKLGSSLQIIAAELQGSVYIMPKVELFSRYEFAYITGVNNSVLPSQLKDPGPMNLITTGFNWYLDGQDMKWTTDFGVSVTDLHPWFADMDAGWRPSRAGEVVFRTQLQMMF